MPCPYPKLTLRHQIWKPTYIYDKASFYRLTGTSFIYSQLGQYPKAFYPPSHRRLSVQPSGTSHHGHTYLSSTVVDSSSNSLGQPVQEVSHGARRVNAEDRDKRCCHHAPKPDSRRLPPHKAFTTTTATHVTHTLDLVLPLLPGPLPSWLHSTLSKLRPLFLRGSSVSNYQYDSTKILWQEAKAEDLSIRV